LDYGKIDRSKNKRITSHSIENTPDSIVNKKFDCYLLMTIAICAQWAFCDGVSALPRTASEPTPTVNKFVYAPIRLTPNLEINDTLSDRDIPTGDGGFARDYQIELKAGDRIAIDLQSEAFDSVVMLMNAEGKNIGKNDDAPDGSSNSLLFTQVKDAGVYIIRVRGFGDTSSGTFKLKVSKLKLSG
jgi:Bacterial pre-peptidase C-terminal domain